jgi:UDP-N-acetylmuramyl pentapeptide phosphotransferase/UDP-N-acetylglucosamine-1-phosphate transferase
VNVSQAQLLYSVTVAGTSAVLVGLVRRLVVARGVIDHPSERSSHVTPTPRGGGLGAVVAILAALTTVGVTTRDVGLLAAVAGCSAVALVGWEDDRRGMPVWSKLPEAQRWQLVSYLQTLKMYAPAPAATTSETK